MWPLTTLPLKQQQHFHQLIPCKKKCDNCEQEEYRTFFCQPANPTMKSYRFSDPCLGFHVMQVLIFQEKFLDFPSGSSKHIINKVRSVRQVNYKQNLSLSSSWHNIDADGISHSCPVNTGAPALDKARLWLLKQRGVVLGFKVVYQKHLSRESARCIWRHGTLDSPLLFPEHYFTLYLAVKSELIPYIWHLFISLFDQYTVVVKKSTEHKSLIESYNLLSLFTFILAIRMLKLLTVLICLNVDDASLSDSCLIKSIMLCSLSHEACH